MLEQITQHTTIRELQNMEELAPIRDYLFTHMTEDVLENPLSSYRPDVCNIKAGLERVITLLNAGQKILYDVYTKEEQEQEPDKAEVKLLYLPGINQETEKKPYVLFCPGGGYFRQWVMVEGYPTALEYNEQGYPVFLLLYRAGQKGVLPKPMEDVSAALRVIEEHAEELKVDAKRYAIGGFSAGGHVASMWGTRELGYAHYDAKKPEAVFLIYPASSLLCLFAPNVPVEQQPGLEFLVRTLGDEITQENIMKYSAEIHVDEMYPPTYVLQNQDDHTVPVITSYRMEEALEKQHVPHLCRFPQVGDHACGVAHGLEAEGWVKETIDFWTTYQAYQIAQKK